MTLDAVDMESLSSSIETQRRAYLVDITRIRARKGTHRRLRIPASILIAALDSLDLMLASGVRINTALRTLSECAPAGSARTLWTEVARQVEGTGSFGESLRGFPRIFNDTMVGVISAHESAGRLPEGVRHVRDYAAQMLALRRESARGLAYPLLLCGAGLGASAVLCEFTLPRFSRMLRDVGVTKTNPFTAFFFGLSHWVVVHPVLCLAVLSSPALMGWISLRPRFRPVLDAALLWIPVVKGAVEALAMARICVTYRALSESGIRAVEALESCVQVAGNAVYARAIGTVVDSVRGNATVGVGFERAGVFAPEVVLAVKSGEGSLPQVFGRLADYYASEARHRVALAVGLIEPVMLLVVLLWVFGVALAVVLPVVSVIDEIH